MNIPDERKIRKRDLWEQIMDVRGTIENKQGEVMTQVQDVKNEVSSHFDKINALGRENKRLLGIQGEEALNDAVEKVTAVIKKATEKLNASSDAKANGLGRHLSIAQKGLDQKLVDEVDMRLGEFRKVSRAILQENVKFKIAIGEQFALYQAGIMKHITQVNVKVNKLTITVAKLEKRKR